MKPNTPRKPLPGLALIFYLTLAITMVRDLSQLVASIRIYAENWAVVPHTLAAADLTLRAVSLLLGALMLWLLSRRDARFLLALILNLVSQMVFLFFYFAVLGAASASAMGSLILSAVWYTYFRFSPRVAAVMPIPGAQPPKAPDDKARDADGQDAADGAKESAGAAETAKEDAEDAHEAEDAQEAQEAETFDANAQEENAQDAQGAPRR